MTVVRVRRGKRIEPLKVVRKPRKIDMELLKKDVKENPDSYQRERAKKSMWAKLVSIMIML